MTTTPHPGPPHLSVPPGWGVRVPTLADIDELTRLQDRHDQAVRGSGHADRQMVASEVAGPASWTRQQVVLTDARDVIRAWASVHDRAAGRTNVMLLVCPTLADDVADRIALMLLDWMTEVAGEICAFRGLRHTQLDAGVIQGDERLVRWLKDDGFTCTRTWLQMSRPVAADETEPSVRAGVTIRRVATHPDGSPVAADLQAVHYVLEQSFEDHFNAFRESFAEFVQRQREDPGHRWDHWWLATVEIGDEAVYAGAVVSTVIPPDDSGREGSYIDYIGVNRAARGRGVAKSLLFTVIADAARRGRGRVGLEVDADSPTGADGLYLSLGWQTSYRTQSWHRELSV